MEEREWKPFRNALDKSDRKRFDEIFDIPRLYISSCSLTAVQHIKRVVHSGGSNRGFLLVRNHLLAHDLGLGCGITEFCLHEVYTFLSALKQGMPSIRWLGCCQEHCYRPYYPSCCYDCKYCDYGM
jgi:hypothetical protein